MKVLNPVQDKTFTPNTQRISPKTEDKAPLRTANKIEVIKVAQNVKAPLSDLAKGMQAYEKSKQEVVEAEKKVIFEQQILIQEQAKIVHYDTILKNNEKEAKKLDNELKKIDEALVKLDNKLVQGDGSLVRVDDSLVKVDDSLAKVDDSLAKVDEKLQHSDKSIATIKSEIVTHTKEGIALLLKAVSFMFGGIKLDENETKNIIEKYIETGRIYVDKGPMFKSMDFVINVLKDMSSKNISTLNFAIFKKGLPDATVLVDYLNETATTTVKILKFAKELKTDANFMKAIGVLDQKRFTVQGLD